MNKLKRIASIVGYGSMGALCGVAWFIVSFIVLVYSIIKHKVFMRLLIFCAIVVFIVIIKIYREPGDDKRSIIRDGMKSVGY